MAPEAITLYIGQQQTSQTSVVVMTTTATATLAPGPQMIPEDQLLFWSPEWQALERGVARGPR
jgi:hypothetical protein